MICYSMNKVSHVSGTELLTGLIIVTVVMMTMAVNKDQPIYSFAGRLLLGLTAYIIKLKTVVAIGMAVI